MKASLSVALVFCISSWFIFKTCFFCLSSSISSPAFVIASTSGPRYDRDALTFSPDGSIKQLDYAAKSVDRSSLCVGIRCKDNVILGVNKILPRLSSLKLETTSAATDELRTKYKSQNEVLQQGNSMKKAKFMRNLRILRVNENIHILIAGHFSDGNALLNYARTLSSRYKITYGEEICGKILAEKLASYFYRVSTSIDQRPLPNVALLAVKSPGVAIGHELHVVDTYAITCQYRACAFGLDSKRVRDQLHEIDWVSLETNQALQKLKQILKDNRDRISFEKKLEEETYEIVSEIGHYDNEGAFEVNQI